jgi:hypothetical protein
MQETCEPVAATPMKTVEFLKFREEVRAGNLNGFDDFLPGPNAKHCSVGRRRNSGDTRRVDATSAS